MVLPAAFPHTLPFITADRPGTGGRGPASDDDFRVEELPRVRPCGRGDHLYFEIEKRGIPTDAAVRALARHLGRKEREFGCAGLKDARAVTGQWLSLEGADEGDLDGLELAGGRLRVRVLDRHTHKLKKGQSAGNRFRIVLRGTAPGAAAAARALLEELARRGVPNYFGPQRFGAKGDNHAVGAALAAGDFDRALAAFLGPGPAGAESALVEEARRRFAAGDLQGARAAFPASYRSERTVLAKMLERPDAKRAMGSLPRSMRIFMLHALQAAMFNACVAERIGELDRLWAGDLAWIHAKGAVFRVEDSSRVQPRADAFEVSPSGPLAGRRMAEPEGPQAAIEATAAAAFGIDPRRFAEHMRPVVRGARRPLRVPIEEVDVADADEGEGTLALSFRLPPGSYATVVLREVMKSPPDAGDQ